MTSKAIRIHCRICWSEHISNCFSCHSVCRQDRPSNPAPYYGQDISQNHPSKGQVFQMAVPHATRPWLPSQVFHFLWQVPIFIGNDDVGVLFRFLKNAQCLRIITQNGRHLWLHSYILIKSLDIGRLLTWCAPLPYGWSSIETKYMGPPA